MALENDVQKSLIQALGINAKGKKNSIGAGLHIESESEEWIVVHVQEMKSFSTSVCFTKDGEHAGTASSSHWRQCSSPALPWLGDLYRPFQTLHNNWSEEEEAKRQRKSHDKPCHWSDSSGFHVLPLDHDLPPGSTGCWICSLWAWITSNGRIFGFWGYGPGTLFWLWEAGAPPRLLGPSVDRERHFVLFLCQLQAIDARNNDDPDACWRPGTWPRIPGEFLNREP